MPHIEPHLAFSEYGHSGGRLVIYFHGAPGSVAEASIFERFAKDHNLRLVCLDRFAVPPSFERKTYYQFLADEIERLAGAGPVDLIGFSIGAHVGLEVAAILGDRVRRIHLVAPAAPLMAGDFIDHMAGGQIFGLALKMPFVFRMLTRFQTLLASIAPGQLVGMIFASAAGRDSALLQEDDFNRYITAVLRQCFRGRANGYIRDIANYVIWQGECIRDISGLSVVSLWHGSNDNWSPFAMSLYLADAIPAAAPVQMLKGASHYSCLLEAAPKIFANAAKS